MLKQPGIFQQSFPTLRLQLDHRRRVTWFLHRSKGKILPKCLLSSITSTRESLMKSFKVAVGKDFRIDTEKRFTDVEQNYMNR